MNSLQIKCFLEVARHGNFSSAAKFLFISQPSVSRNIQELEKEWNITLFIRKWGSATLTEAGSIMYDYFSTEEGVFRKTLDKAQHVHTHYNGSISIDFVHGQMLNSIIREAIRDMNKKWPGTELRIERHDYDEIRERLIKKEVDIAEIPRGAISFKDEEMVIYCQYETYLVIPESSPYAYKKNLSMEQFLEETFIAVDKNNGEPDEFEVLWTQECAKRGIKPKIRKVSDIKQQEILVELGEGVSVCNINHMLTNSPHTRFVLLGELYPLPFVMVWNKTNMNPNIKKFIECLKANPDTVI